MEYKEYLTIAFRMAFESANISITGIPTNAEFGALEKAIEKKLGYSATEKSYKNLYDSQEYPLKGYTQHYLAAYILVQKTNESVPTLKQDFQRIYWDKFKEWYHETTGSNTTNQEEKQYKSSISTTHPFLSAYQLHASSHAEELKKYCGTYRLIAIKNIDTNSNKESDSFTTKIITIIQNANITEITQNDGKWIYGGVVFKVDNYIAYWFRDITTKQSYIRDIGMELFQYVEYDTATFIYAIEASIDYHQRPMARYTVLQRLQDDDIDREPKVYKFEDIHEILHTTSNEQTKQKLENAILFLLDKYRLGKERIVHKSLVPTVEHIDFSLSFQEKIQKLLHKNTKEGELTKPNTANYNLKNLVGIYYGVRCLTDGEIYRPIALIITTDKVLLKGIFKYEGKINLFKDRLMLEFYLENNFDSNINIVMFANVRNYLFSSEHIQYLILDYVYTNEGGVTTGRDIFIYQPNETKYTNIMQTDNIEDIVDIEKLLSKIPNITPSFFLGKETSRSCFLHEDSFLRYMKKNISNKVEPTISYPSIDLNNWEIIFINNFKDAKPIFHTHYLAQEHNQITITPSLFHKDQGKGRNKATIDGSYEENFFVIDICKSSVRLSIYAEKTNFDRKIPMIALISGKKVEHSSMTAFNAILYHKEVFEENKQHIKDFLTKYSTEIIVKETFWQYKTEQQDS